MRSGSGCLYLRGVDRLGFRISADRGAFENSCHGYSYRGALFRLCGDSDRTGAKWKKCHRIALGLGASTSRRGLACGQRLGVSGRRVGGGGGGLREIDLACRDVWWASLWRSEGGFFRAVEEKPFDGRRPDPSPHLTNHGPRGGEIFPWFAASHWALRRRSEYWLRGDDGFHALVIHRAPICLRIASSGEPCGSLACGHELLARGIHLRRRARGDGGILPRHRGFFAGAEFCGFRPPAGLAAGGRGISHFCWSGTHAHRGCRRKALDHATARHRGGVGSGGLCNRHSTLRGSWRCRSGGGHGILHGGRVAA